MTIYTIVIESYKTAYGKKRKKQKLEKYCTLDFYSIFDMLSISLQYSF